MQSTINHISDFVAKASNLAETKAEIFKLTTARKVSFTLAGLITTITLLVVSLLVLVILSIGTAIWLGPQLGGMSYGFFAVGAFYTVTGLILFAFRKRILSRPLNNYIITKIFE